ncbi:uncharacterized protein SCHCODRAFT_01170374 [Schizophyllum commune H4-8]|nr:uncharacterized protein SCHCODRAFT_01170374 [Schizophyllum commune H4-8]KAI5896176.1 hypothetical protein SCHCODRAFT_01170374 [Schizophyllum commune H4-8]
MIASSLSPATSRTTKKSLPNEWYVALEATSRERSYVQANGVTRDGTHALTVTVILILPDLHFMETASEEDIRLWLGHAQKRFQELSERISCLEAENERLHGLHEKTQECLLQKKAIFQQLYATMVTMMEEDVSLCSVIRTLHLNLNKWENKEATVAKGLDIGPNLPFRQELLDLADSCYRLCPDESKD